MYYIILLLVILISILAIIFFIRKEKKLTKKYKVFFQEKLKYINTKNISNKEKIIDIDKLFHKILLKKGYKGSFGNILKKNPKFLNINKIWKLHKLRNKLVHSLYEFNNKNLEKDLHEYIIETQKIIER